MHSSAPDSGDAKQRCLPGISAAASLLRGATLIALTSLATLTPLTTASGQMQQVQKQQAVSISGGGATERGKATVTGNPSFKNFEVTVNASEASALLTWMQQLYRRQTVEPTPIMIRLANGQKIEFLEPKITHVDLSGTKTVKIEFKHRDGILRLVVPKGAWVGSWPPRKK